MDRQHYLYIFYVILASAALFSGFFLGKFANFQNVQVYEKQKDYDSLYKSVSNLYSIIKSQSLTAGLCHWRRFLGGSGFYIKVRIPLKNNFFITYIFNTVFRVFFNTKFINPIFSEFLTLKLFFIFNTIFFEFLTLKFFNTIFFVFYNTNFLTQFFYLQNLTFFHINSSQ